MLSQHELSRKAGVKFPRLRYAESGRLKLTHDERERIEAAIRAVLVKRMAEISRMLAARAWRNGRSERRNEKQPNSLSTGRQMDVCVPASPLEEPRGSTPASAPIPEAVQR